MCSSVQVTTNIVATLFYTMDLLSGFAEIAFSYGSVKQWLPYLLLLW